MRRIQSLLSRANSLKSDRMRMEVNEATVENEIDCHRCPSCTLINSVDLHACEACGNPLKLDATSEPNDPRRCNHCSLINVEGLDDCAMCGLPLHQPASAARAVFVGDMETTAGLLVCLECTYKNPESVNICQVCCAPLSPAEKQRQNEDEQVARLHQMLWDEAECDEVKKEEEDLYMMSTSSGKSVGFVSEIVKLQKKLDPDFQKMNPQSNQELKTVAVDDIVFLTEKLIALQETFRVVGKDATVTIGYHYTKSQNLEGIRRDGLLSAPERQASNVSCVRGGGATFGDGVYTGSNPLSFRSFGDCGLIVAILKGTVKRLRGSDRSDDGADTVIGNKSRPNQSTPHHQDEIVLKQSAQCLPLISFSTSLISGQPHVTANAAGHLLWRYHQELQFLVDEFLNNGVEVQPNMVLSERSPSLPRILRPSQTKVGPTTPRVAIDTTTSDVPVASGNSFSLLSGKWLSSLARPTPVTPKRTVVASNVEGTLSYSAPSSLDLSRRLDSCMVHVATQVRQECPICLTAMSSSVVQLSACQHSFHEECLSRALKQQPNCPMCRKSICEPQGKSPSGTMTVCIISKKCSGYRCNTIQIEYSMQRGTQKEYHQSPGTSYGSTTRTAYVPNNNDGQMLLQRLKYAFMHGLTFTVGTSLTSGSSNVITWSSIHHKTTLSGGAHGYPDTGYFYNCNEELDAVGVPGADSTELLSI